MAKLEDALRQKKKAVAKRAAEEIEELKVAARRKLRLDLLFIDNEVDSLTAGDAKGGLKAAKWLLEHAYVKYPPPTFNKRKVAEQVNAARALRFKDATIKALKLLEMRYAPHKNTASEYGAERAVIAEEIAKHAYGLITAVSRGMSQEMVASA
eukprot:1214986-Prymnesium_polylepis.1